MQIRDFLEHEWQTIGAVRERIARKGGVPLAEVTLLRVIQRTVPDAIFTPDNKQVRLLPPAPVNDWPAPRGTTHQQLTAMHLQAESEAP